MNQNEALGVLIRAARAAYARGAFKMDEVAAIDEAIKIFIIEETPVENTEVAPENAAENAAANVNMSEEDKSAS